MLTGLTLVPTLGICWTSSAGRGPRENPVMLCDQRCANLEVVSSVYYQHGLRSFRPIYQGDVLHQSQRAHGLEYNRTPAAGRPLRVDDKAVYFVSDSWEEESARAGIREALL